MYYFNENCIFNLGDSERFDIYKIAEKYFRNKNETSIIDSLQGGWNISYFKFVIDGIYLELSFTDFAGTELKASKFCSERDMLKIDTWVNEILNISFLNNLFDYAMDHSELDLFLLGQGKYFILDKEYGGHWPLESYRRYIETYLNSKNFIFPNKFWNDFISIFKAKEDPNLLLDAIFTYLLPYYNCENKMVLKKRAEKTPIEMIRMVDDYILKNKLSLIQDNRGTGMDWNSNEGLYGSIITNINTIRRRGGPDFIPSLTI